MKLYEKKPERIVAVKIDFSTPDAAWHTMQDLDMCAHILIHKFGDREYTIRLFDDKDATEFTHGDYICHNINDNHWYGIKGYTFKEDWNEVDSR